MSPWEVSDLTIVGQSRHHIFTNVKYFRLKLTKITGIVWHYSLWYTWGGEGNGKREGRREKGSREVERLLLSSSKSTVNNAGNYQGRQKKKGRDGDLENERGREGGRKGGRGQKEREEEGKHYSSVPSKHEMLGYFNKKPPFIWERKRETACKRKTAETQRKKLRNGKWKHQAADNQLLSWDWS